MAVNRAKEEALEEFAGISVREEEGVLARRSFHAIAEILVRHYGKALVLVPDGGIHQGLGGRDGQHGRSLRSAEGAGEAAAFRHPPQAQDHRRGVGRILGQAEEQERSEGAAVVNGERQRARAERSQAPFPDLLGDAPDEGGAGVLFPVKDESGESLGAVGEQRGAVPDIVQAEDGDGVRRDGAQQRVLHSGIRLPPGRALLSRISLVEENDSGGYPREEKCRYDY